MSDTSLFKSTAQGNDNDAANLQKKIVDKEVTYIEVINQSMKPSRC